MFYSLRRWNYEIKAAPVGPSPAFHALYAETGLTYKEMIEREIGKVGRPTVEMGGEEYFEDGTGERGVFCFTPFILDCSQMNAIGKCFGQLSAGFLFAFRDASV
jgi:hypothetical protein